MYNQHRFREAYKKIDQIADPILKIEGVWGVFLEETPDYDKDNPCGPRYVVYASDPAPAMEAQNKGLIPTYVDTKYDSVAVVIICEAFDDYSDGVHTGQDDPMRPGSSIGSIAADGSQNTGTLGAVVETPGSGDHIITAGHVLLGRGTTVYQPGPADEPNSRQVGTVVSNPYRDSAGVDAALARINSSYGVSPKPYDNIPAPSRETPAVGLLKGGGGPVQRYLDIGECLRGVGATLSRDKIMRLTDNNLGDRIFASGRTSGAIEARICGIGRMGLPNGYSALAITCEKIRGGEEGDSGAVAVMRLGRCTLWSETDEQTLIDSTDTDDVKEWLPGAFADLDELMANEGAGISANGTQVTSEEGKNIVGRIISYLKKIGDLGVVVSTHCYKSPCKKVESDLMKKYVPTPCKEIICRPGEKAESPNELGGELVKQDGMCCTFGKVPYVVVSGDDAAKKSFNIEIAKCTLQIVLSVEQTVMSARFHRHGICYTGTCDEEFLKGTVLLSRKFNLKLSASAGEINLPLIGTLRAAGGALEIENVKTITKTFVIPCHDPGQ